MMIHIEVPVVFLLDVRVCVLHWFVASEIAKENIVSSIKGHHGNAAVGSTCHPGVRVINDAVLEVEYLPRAWVGEALELEDVPVRSGDFETAVGIARLCNHLLFRPAVDTRRDCRRGAEQSTGNHAVDLREECSHPPVDLSYHPEGGQNDRQREYGEHTEAY